MNNLAMQAVLPDGSQELVTLSGVTYAYVPDGTTLPTQPNGITLTEVTAANTVATVRDQSPAGQLISRQQADRTTNTPLSAEQAALWAQQQLQALGLATAADVTTAALGILAARRYESETAGTTWNGHPVATDRQSQSLITGAVVASQLPGFTSVDWKMADGEFVTLSASDVVAMAQAVVAHVTAAFANEQALKSAVTADINADIETGWPS